MAELKTRPTDGSVETFLNSIAHEGRRADSFRLVELMRKATGAEARMWGPSIIGFGDYVYKYDSGRGGEWFKVGFSPRKDSLSLYIMAGIERFPHVLARLGKYSTGKACLYVKRLEDVDVEVLRELIDASLAWLAESERKRSGESKLGR